MDITDRIKRQMHGIKDTRVLSAQGQTKFMQSKSGFPVGNPIGDYYKGKGKSVMKSMRKRYGKRAKEVFYATANKRGMKG